jgi:hypothetical protein
MRDFALLILVLFATPFAVWSQDDARQQVEKLRTLVQSFGPRPTKVAILGRTLIVTRGKIVRSREASFDLKHNGGVTTIFYENVLELGSAKGSISFVPDRATRNHGSWIDIGRIYPGTKVLLIYGDGTSARGFSHSITETHLVMFDKNGRERVDVHRDKIAAFYGLVGGYGGVKAGASKGAEGMTNDRDVLLDGVFAGIGALVGLAKSDGRPILIYSK